MKDGAMTNPENPAVIGTEQRAELVTDGDVFSLDGETWHTAAVNMAAMGTISCYVSGRKSSRGMTYRVPVSASTPVIVRAAAAS